jgi:hypothetical protein
MTELEAADSRTAKAALLQGHRTQRAYAKRTLERALPATRKRDAHRLLNVQRTNFQNEPRLDFQNDEDAEIA